MRSILVASLHVIASFPCHVPRKIQSMTQDSTSPASPAPTTGYPPLTGGKLIVATIVVALATFMSALDVSIANVAIPTISGNLGVSVDEGTWVITIFAAANVISISLTVWVRARVGPVMRAV